MARHWSFWMPALEHRSIRVLDDWHRTLLTPMGRVLFWSAGAGAFLLVGGLVPLLLGAVSFALAALAAGAFVGIFFRPRVALRRCYSSPVCAGETMTYWVEVANVGSYVAREITVDERHLPPELRPVGETPVIERLLPGDKAKVAMKLACRKRGGWDLCAIQVASAYPFGLIKVPKKLRERERLVVYPRYCRIERFEVPHGRNHQPGGLPVASKVGESCEFLGTREWRDGDSLRDIHWKSAARAGRLIVREFQEEYFVRLALVLDVEVRSRREERLFEKAVSMTAAIAEVLARQEYVVDIFAAGSEVFRFQAGRAIAHFENVLEILACIESGNRLDVEALRAAVIPEAQRMSAVVLVLMDWDECRASLVSDLRAHGVAVRVLCMRSKRHFDGLAADEFVDWTALA